LEHHDTRIRFLGGSDRITVERSRGTAMNTRAGEGSGGFFGAGGHTTAGSSLLYSDIGVDSSRSSSSAAAFAPSPAGGVADGDAEAEAQGRAGKGAVLMGGSSGRASSAGDAIAAPSPHSNYRRRPRAVNWDRILLGPVGGGGAIARTRGG